MEAFLHVLSMLATGLVILVVAFMALAEISPTEVAGLSAIVLAVAVVLLVRGRRLEREVRSRSGSPDLRDAANRQRERRGF
jgi:membrane protein implicated in regulation of membrane protease activity